MQSRNVSAVVVPGLAVAFALLARPAASQEPTRPKPTPEQAAFFETRVRPTLFASCQNCHQKENPQGGLRLDQPLTLAKAQLALTRVRGEGNKPRMPQGAAPLTQEKIAALETWVAQGAPWPDAPLPADGNLWSLKPVRKTEPPRVKNVSWVRNPIDAFLLAKLEARGLPPAPPADRRTLMRRVTYDLTGLPPSTGEMQAFLADKSPDAFTKVVDRLLASPRYGERWGRLWLDIARYADTKGYVFNEDRNYYNAYTYRDWVIDAFNRDLPYDQFVIQQIAADRLPEGEDRRPLAALGFLTVGRRFLNAQPDIIDDRIDVVMRGFQGLTAGCARCHDHKFDPIPTQDYYSLYSIFASSVENSPTISPRSIADPWEKHNASIQAAQAQHDNLIREETQSLRERTKPGVAAVGTPVSEKVRKALQAVRENELPSGENLKAIEEGFPAPRRERLAQLRAELAQLRGSMPPTPEFAMGMSDGQPTVVNVFKRGNPGNPGDPAPRRFLRCVAGDARPEWSKGSGRLELAQTIASKDNPLTARVFVNRVWNWHFGRGLVRTPSDFGHQGEKPTHPELLDWLAWNFMHDDGWSIKKLHRRLVLTSAYQMSSLITEKALVLDPENRLLSRQNRRRLDLEQLRDSLLTASGALDLTQVGGKSVDLWSKPFASRRAVYGFVERQNLPLVFKTFDFATPDVSSAQRFQTTVPQQILFLLNGPLAVEQATHLAALPELARFADDAARVRALYLRLFGRLPTASEAQAAQNYLSRQDPPARGTATAEPLWRYGWGLYDSSTQIVTDFHAFAHFRDGMWRGGEKLPDPTIGWCMLTATGGHPGDRNHAAIRRWTAPTDGVLAIDGTLRHPVDQGDGVRARIVASRGGQLGEWSVHNGTAKTDIARLEVRKGDWIDFVVESGSNESFDAFAWAPILRRIDSNKSVWNAEAGFAGPAEMIKPLDRWQRYAQALLLTNEFLFVD